MVHDIIAEILTSIGPPERKNWRLWLLVAGLAIGLCALLALAAS